MREHRLIGDDRTGPRDFRTMGGGVSPGRLPSAMGADRSTHLLLDFRPPLASGMRLPSAQNHRNRCRDDGHNERFRGRNFFLEAKAVDRAGSGADYCHPQAWTPRQAIVFPGWGGWIRTSAWRYQKPKFRLVKLTDLRGIRSRFAVLFQWDAQDLRNIWASNSVSSLQTMPRTRQGPGERRLPEFRSTCGEAGGRQVALTMRYISQSRAIN